MSDGFHVATDALDGIARTLDGVSQGLEGLAGSIPAIPEAGAVTADLASALGHLLAQVGELSVGSAAAAAGVRRSLRTYLTADRQAEAGLSASGAAGPGGR
ncbi:hypothetical protein ACIB24_22550 [Spongisporangium articulatum]|uniref:Excreted virulence factor EspC, type VII ESX diderm n=1 Tax=Spongisporangium articulatum TaxID=3362603 RepID=A0ABW8AU09_9ACTN